MVGHERLAIVLADVPVGRKTGLGAQVAGKLAAEAIFHKDDLLRLRKNLEDLFRVEGHQPLHVEMVGHDPLLACQLGHRLANHPAGRAPADEGHRRDRGTEELRGSDRLEHPLHLAHALLVHRTAFLRVRVLIADQHAILVVLVARDHVKVAGDARHRPRRDPALGDFVAEVGTIIDPARRGGHRGRVLREDDRAAVDGPVELEGIKIHARGPLGNKEIAQDDSGAVKLVQEIEKLGHRPEGILDAGDRDDRARVIPLAGTEGLPEVPLLGLGGHPRGGAGPLHVDPDDRDLHHRRGTKGLRHQRKPAARGGTHRAAAAVRGTNDHVGHANLILHLANHDPQLARVLREPYEDTRRRAHRVGRKKVHSGGDAAHGERVVASEHPELAPRLREGLRIGLEVCGGVIEAALRGTKILGNHRVPLLLELGGEDPLEVGKLDPEHIQDRAEGHRVREKLVRSEVLAGDPADLDAVGGGAGLDLVGIEDHGAAGLHDRQVTVHCVLVQAEERVDPIAMGEHFPVARAESQEGVTAPDDGLVGVVGDEVKAAAGEDAGKDISRGRNPLPVLAANSDGKVSLRHGRQV